MNNMKKPHVIHPWLLALFPVLFLYSYNQAELLLGFTLLPLFLTILFTLFLFFLLFFFLKESVKAGLVASSLILLFFSYGHVYTVLDKVLRKVGLITGSPISHEFALFLVTLPVLWCIYWVVRSKRDHYTLTSFLNGLSCVLVIFCLMKIGYFEFQHRRIGNYIDEITTLSQKDTSSTKPKRDIIFIMLDAYARADVLKKSYNYSNEDFTDYLTQKGFRVIPNSKSNYANTVFSLAGTLNMEYLKDRDLFYDRKFYSMIRDNKVVRFLKSKGYKFVNINGSGNNFTSSFPVADLNLEVEKLVHNDFSAILMDHTILFPFIEKRERGLSTISRSSRREHILFAFSALSDIYKIEGPKFVFCHIVCPHGPYVFETDGDLLPVQEWNEASFTQSYLDQVTFVNKKVMEVIDDILSKSTSPPVIILQSDHGRPSDIFADFLLRNTKFSTRTPKTLWEAFGNLNAMYFPPEDEVPEYNSITSVNTFRFIANSYFNMDYELLDDKVIWVYQEKMPYKFIDITDTVTGYLERSEAQ